MMGDPWTYQVSVGLAPPPESPPSLPDAPRCPACGWPMYSARGDLEGFTRTDRYWRCIRCKLEVLRPGGDPP
jgi:hypothetical protein